MAEHAGRDERDSEPGLDEGERDLVVAGFVGDVRAAASGAGGEFEADPVGLADAAGDPLVVGEVGDAEPGAAGLRVVRGQNDPERVVQQQLAGAVRGDRSSGMPG